jgi:energy-coupling factor transport system ATP-binding protein
MPAPASVAPPITPPRRIVADELGYRYPGASAPAIRDISFRLEEGEVLLVVGPSGSGKSTLARAIAGVSSGAGGTPSSAGGWTGRLWVGDVDVSADPTRWLGGLVGLVMQDPASQLVMDRVADDVAFGLENRGWPLAAMRARVPVALDEAGLSGFEERRAVRLSGGEQQRVALAGALAPMTGVLVLDEPTANLDPPGADAVFDRLEALKALRSTTIVLVEHRVERAWPLADRVLALASDGSPIDLGSPDEVLRRSGARMAREGIWLPSDAVSAPFEERGRRPGSSVRPAVDVPRPRPVHAEPLLAMREVRYAYEPGVPVVRDVDLAIRAGDRVALVGPNGSGKSTLLRLAAGLLRPTAGAVRVLDGDPARMASGARARTIGFVHQDPELGFLADTVAEEIALGLTATEHLAVEELMERLGLPLARFAAASPYRLSGGEQRRLSLATALVRRPRLLLLDEPTFGQDRHGHEALVSLLDELVGDRTAVLAATHDERFVRDAMDSRIEMAEGWIVETERVA